MKEENKKKNKIITILLMLALVFMAVVPMFRSYVPDSGESLFWSGRIIKILSNRNFMMYKPLFILSGSFLRIGIVLSALLFFKTIHKDIENSALIGTALFIFSPYQMFIAFDKYDFADMLLWIFILIFMTVLTLIIRSKSVGTKIILILPEILIVLFMVLALVLSYTPESALSFEGKGYVIGELFTSFFYMEGHPGLGIVLVISMMIWIAMLILKSNSCKFISAFAIIGAVSLVLSLQIFPWDVIGRILPFMTKIFNLIESPTIFLGIGTLCFSVVSVKVINELKKSKNEFVNTILPILLIVTAVALGLFLSGFYMFNQSPLEIHSIA